MSRTPCGKQPEPSLDLLRAMDRDAGMGIPNELSEGPTRDNADLDPLGGIAFGHGVLEHILLAIIDGNPDERSREKRLAQAMIALVDRKPHKAPLPVAAGKHPGNAHRLENALIFMGERWYAAGKRKPSANQLAQLAAEKFLDTENPDLIHRFKEDLAERFTGRYRRNHTKGVPEHDVSMTHVYRAVIHDHLRESVERQITGRICHELERAGVRVSIPGD